MKILHIMNELRPSGAEVMLELAAPEWLLMGCELHLVALAESPGPQAERLRAAGWRISHLSRIGSTWKLISRITRAIRAIQPDVVHLHQEGKSLPICYAVRRAGVPMVRTVHNNFPFAGLLRLRKTFERKLCRLMGSRHVAISPSVKANELTRFHNPSQLCWNWFDAQSFRPPITGERHAARERLGIPRDQIVAVSVGNGSDIKNYRVIVEALSTLGNSNAHYYQVGNPHPQGLDERMADELGVTDQVHWIGPRKDILDWLWASDLYLMPSIFEGYGLAAVEALAAGCECVFADCPGLADFKEIGIHARWKPPTAEAFSRAIASAFAQPCDSKLLAHNAEITRSAFAVEPRARAYYDVWVSARASKSR
jgi:glycosyltransferase involved in cell wall biosynthesis